MNAPVTTSTLLVSTAPMVPAVAPPTAETVAGGGFQPVLAALTQAAAQGASAVLPPGTAAAMPQATTGKLLPASGQRLPQLVDAEASTAELDTALMAPVDPALMPVDPATALPVSSDAIAPAINLVTSADVENVAVEAASDFTFASSDGMAEPVAEQAASTTSPIVITAAPVAVPAATASGPAIPPPVSGEIKRMLPESTAKAAPRSPANETAANGAAAAASASTPVDDGAPPVFDLASLTQVVEGAATAEQPSAQSGSTAAVSALRESSLRAYQTAAPATAQVEVPVGRQGWSEAVLEKVMWFSAQQMGSAEIHLNPAELGPLSVRISTHQDQASVYFSSQHAAVRDALDQALPRLREMLDGQGIQLLDAGVGEQRQTRQQAGQQGGGSAGLAAENGDDLSEGTAAEAGSRSLLLNSRLLDAYA